MLKRAIIFICVMMFQAGFIGTSFAAEATDQEIYKQYKQTLNAINNDLKAIQTSKMADDEVVSGYKERLAGLKTIIQSFHDENYKKQVLNNYKSFEKWFEQRVASAKRQVAADAERNRRKAERERAAAEADKARADDFAAREQARQKRIADRNARNSALRTQPSTPRSSGASGQPSDAATHKAFGRAYQDVRVSLQFLKAAELNEPREAAYWKRKLNEFAVIVAKFQDTSNPDVAADLETYHAMKAKLEGLMGASKKTDVASYPDYSKDLATLKTMAEKYKGSAIFTREAASRAKYLNDEYGKNRHMQQSLAKKYDAFLKGNMSANDPSSREARELRRWLKNAYDNLAAFHRSKKDFYDEFESELKKHMDKAESLMQDAIANKKTYFFSNGAIERQMKKSEDLLYVYKALAGDSDGSYQAYRKDFDALSAKVVSTETSLSDSITASRNTPDDTYRASNREAILKLNREAFVKVFPDKKILAEGIYGAEGERKAFTGWNSGGDWDHFDFTEVYTWIITEKNAEKASLFSSWVYVNHLENDKLKAYGYKKDAKGRDMLLKNVRH